jgi:ubiquitin C-terminal hydrolase
LDLNIEILRDKNIETINIPYDKPIPEGEIKHPGLVYPSKNIKIPKLLYSFFSPEILTKQNYFHCEKCKMSQAVKKLYLKDPPRVLTVVIKRFTNGLIKNNSHVEFPFEMSLDGVSITPGEWMYRLYAVVVHQGSVSGGHYISYTRRGDNWYYFSDSHFKQTSLESVKSAQAYILFYELTK